ncbi:hypothetical protein K2224_32435 (plasmid) [Streptomyces sp. BHT-5-2]|uniref:hypothetical protein n=1 Tax=unclassified Streptomyces TaxID=2593676 RepID=UPI001C8E96DA|nr:hypothetical protein [Streptomyces sp. BHT-5-2]QZL07901.1 hypothetical protein K2224_32435 [Streptomyces sp. BHT-5-2]
MRTQAKPSDRRGKRTALRTTLAVAVTGAAVALPVGAASAMPTDYVKQVKVDSGETVTLDGYSGTATIKDPEHGVTRVLNHDKHGPVPSRMDPNGTFTLSEPKPAAQADATAKIVYRHDGKTVKTISFPKAPADLG